MTDPMTISTIADGLTKAQRRMIAAAEHIEGTNYWLISPHPRSRPFLRARGLIVTYSVWRDKLTPLGLAVREYLRTGK